MPFFGRHDDESEFAYDAEPESEEVTNYLSDILDGQKHVEEMLTELVNQGDRQVEFLSRLVTLFERAAKESELQRQENIARNSGREATFE